MKKRKFFVAALILGAASIGTYSVTQKYNKTELSDLALANIEALAQDENEQTYAVVDKIEATREDPITGEIRTVITYICDGHGSLNCGG